jgi:hypothetical protein
MNLAQTSGTCQKSVYVGPESNSLGLKFGLRVDGGRHWRLLVNSVKLSGRRTRRLRSGDFAEDFSFFIQSSSLLCPLSSMNIHGTDFAPSTRFHTVPETGYPSGSNKVLYQHVIELPQQICARPSLSHPWLVCLLKDTGCSLRTASGCRFQRALADSWRYVTHTECTSAQIACSPTEFHLWLAVQALHYGGRLCLATTNIELWKYFCSSTHRQNFEQ